MQDFVGKEGTVFQFNSDLEGDVYVIPLGKEPIKVPGKDILGLVGYGYVLPKKIALLEEKEYSELLLLDK
jgi:pyruvate/2-oxoglutarate/acetoin dehydrogenase E1 component